MRSPEIDELTKKLGYIADRSRKLKTVLIKMAHDLGGGPDHRDT
jgi:hypothetical protein